MIHKKNYIISLNRIQVSIILVEYANIYEFIILFVQAIIVTEGIWENSMKQMKIAIIGGGASGIMAANIAASAGGKVTIFEHKDRIGKKILATGNGKCNLSNLSFSCDYYYSEEEEGKIIAKKVFEQFPVSKTLEYFHDIGLITKEKSGYVYPYSEQATTVLDLLRNELANNGVEIKQEVHVLSIQFKKDDNQYLIVTDIGNFQFDRLIISCGGMANPQSGSDGSGYELAKKLGHNIIKPLPALVQLRCREDYFKSINGVRCEATISTNITNEITLSEFGEVQFTDYGISGIPVFQLSRHIVKYLQANKVILVKIDFFPNMVKHDLEEKIRKRLDEDTYKNLTMEQLFIGFLNKKFVLLFIKLCGLKPDVKCNGIPWEKMKKMILLMKELEVTVYASNSFQNAQVCSGGIDMKQIKETLESKLMKGLYFSGEILDIDGRCGGYNLQWAWSSGYVAGMNAAEGESYVKNSAIKNES